METPPLKLPHNQATEPAAIRTLRDRFQAGSRKTVFFPLGSRAASCELYVVVTPPDFTLDVVLYGLLVLGVFGFLWAYYDRRDRALYDAERRKISFHCIRCDHLYTEKAGIDTAPCPKCGHNNVRLKF